MLGFSSFSSGPLGATGSQGGAFKILQGVQATGTVNTHEGPSASSSITIPSASITASAGTLSVGSAPFKVIASVNATVTAGAALGSVDGSGTVSGVSATTSSGSLLAADIVASGNATLTGVEADGIVSVFGGNIFSVNTVTIASVAGTLTANIETPAGDASKTISGPSTATLTANLPNLPRGNGGAVFTPPSVTGSFTPAVPVSLSGTANVTPTAATSTFSVNAASISIVSQASITLPSILVTGANNLPKPTGVVFNYNAVADNYNRLTTVYILPHESHLVPTVVIREEPPNLVVIDKHYQTSRTVMITS